MILCSFHQRNASIGSRPRFSFPYKKAGLTDRQAAAHLLSRFTYGAKPGQVDELVNMGLEKWFEQELEANLAEDSLNELVKEYDALNYSNTEILEKFPRGPKVRKMAIEAGFINKDSVDGENKKGYREKIDSFMKLKGIRPEQELFRQFINYKILRSANANNQLKEVLTDFWFNHFNVSITKKDCAAFIPVYERDAIRPNVLGNFESLLMATAKSPAMLLYLDNFSSTGTNDSFNKRFPNTPSGKLAKALADTSEKGRKQAQQLQKNNKGASGLNENYAREIMELHTLGVDGGYTQSDVTQAARVLTGWTIYPIVNDGPAAGLKKAIEKYSEDQLQQAGFVHEGDFLFANNRHDDKEKTILGKKFAAGRGYDEGVELINMLATHPSTAKFISKKLAVRFVNDNPPASLIDKMAKTFLDKKGDIKQVLITMVTAPEFWSKDALREKTKSPFELAISAVRSLDATVRQPFQLNNWITKMGQKVYFYQAPTGYPDRGQYWINTGSLLNRMNFGLALAAQKIPGITFSLSAINHNREPESAEDALKTYAGILMPERNLDATIKRLTPLLNNPNLVKKVNDAASKTASATDASMMYTDDMNSSTTMKDKQPKERLNKKGDLKNGTTNLDLQTYAGNNSMLSQVVGIIIGSPEYQRR
jgi:uncharacterized protein (DUF1800 family)